MNSLSPFEIIYCPEIISAGKHFLLTLRINTPICLEIDSPIVKPYDNAPLSFNDTGVFSIKLICDRIINDFSFNIKSENHSVTANIARCLEKPFDDNITMHFGEYADTPLISADFAELKLKAAEMRGMKKARFALPFDQAASDKDTKTALQYLSYMYGATDYYLRQENKFSKFLLSHTRSGKYHTPIAFISDGSGKTDVFSDIMLSLCPNADIIPIKNGAFEDYNTLCLLSENAISQSSSNDLLAFVHTGGTLICALPVLSGGANKLAEYIFFENFNTISDSYCGIPIDICPNVECDDVIATSDSGYPLAFIRRVGLGQIFLINALGAPGQNGVKPLYEAIISEVYDNLKSEEKIFIIGDKEFAFTAYNQQDNARHIYLLALNNLKQHTAVLKINREKYNIDLPFGSMLKIVAKDNLAVWSEDEDVEVLLITANVVTLQGYGKTKIKYAKGGEVSEREIDFTHKPIQAIQI